MAKIPYMPLFIEPFLADTDHLNDAEMGLYIRMLAKMWLAPEQRFPNDIEWLARKFRRSVAEAEIIIIPLVREFFVSTGNWIKNPRLSREFERVRESMEKQSDRAKSRYNKENGECRGSAGPAVPFTSTSTLRKKEETLTAAAESHDPREAAAAAGAPAPKVSFPTLVKVAQQASMSLQAVEARIVLMVAHQGSAVPVELALLKALERCNGGNPLAYAGGMLASMENQRLAAVEAAKAVALEPAVDVIGEAERMTLATIREMETRNGQEFTGAYHGMPDRTTPTVRH